MTTIWSNPTILATLEAQRDKNRELSPQCITTFDCYNCHVCTENPNKARCVKGHVINGSLGGKVEVAQILAGWTKLICRTCPDFDMGLGK